MGLISKPAKTVSNWVAFGNTTAKDLFTLPAGARPLRFLVDVDTAFNDSGTDLLDIGKPGTAAYFANDVDVSATGATAVAPLNNDELTLQTTVTATYTGQNSNASAGLAQVICEYMSPF